MNRRRYAYGLVALIAVLMYGTEAASGADRLGGAYRGPQDQRAAQPEDETEADETEVETGTDHTDSTDEEAGLGTGEREGEGTSSDEESPAGPPESGTEGDTDGEGGIGTESEGPTKGNEHAPDTGSGSEGGLGKSGGPGPGKGKVSAQQHFLRVLWYFEHNRETFLNEVVARKNSLVPPLPYTALDLLTKSHWDRRDRSPVTAEDRERIFDIVRKQATLSDHAVVRDAAAIALGKIGSDPAVEILLERLKTEPSEQVRQDILIALGLSRSEQALDRLAVALSDRAHAAYACFGLALSGDRERGGQIVLDYFRKNRRSKRKLTDQLAAAAIALGHLRYEPAVPDLVKVAKSKSYPETLRVYCAQALGRVGGKTARKALVNLLDKSSQQVERAAALALGDFPEAGVLKSLGGKAGLGSADPLASGFAAMSMAQIMSELPESEWRRYPQELREIAVKPAKDKIKSQYANLALAAFGGFDKETRGFVTGEVLGTKLDASTRSALAIACGVGGLATTEAGLLDVASSSARDDQARCYAAMAYGMVATNSREAAGRLAAIYRKSKQQNVRRGALFGLGLVGDQDHVGLLVDAMMARDNDHFTRGASAAAIGMIRDGRSVDLLERLVSNEEKTTRAFAVAALGFLADKDAVPVLPALFGRNNFRQEFAALRVVMSTL